MRTLYIDIETYSPEDLKKCGVYRYTSHPDFGVILFAYAVDGGPVRTEERMTNELRALLSDPETTIVAHNAMFERVCLSTRYADILPGLRHADWRCSMTLATVAGYPPALKNAAEALRLPTQKMEEGKDLIEFFCTPHTDRDGRTYRNMPEDHPDKWAVFREYCKVDVEVCRLVWQACRFAEYPGLWEEYRTDAEVNDRGVGIDTVLVGSACRFKERMEQEAKVEFNRLTGVDKPKSGKQIQQWLASQGVETDKTDKAAMEAVKRRGGIIGQALEVRENLTRSSLAKYDRMREMEVDGRIRGLFQFYGAARTGRFAGRGIQPQNFPRNSMPDLDGERQAVRAGDWAAWRIFHDRPADTLSQLLRTAFMPREGLLFAVADYSAVEARVLAWLAGERWRQEVFAGDGRIYEATAAQMFHVPAESITKDSPLRARGKIADLALGYGGGVEALKRMGATKQGIKEGELPGIVRGWRAACPSIVRFWGACECAASSAINNPGKTYRLLGNAGGVSFRVTQPLLTPCPSLEIALPSGRRLQYAAPSLELYSGRYRLRYWEEDDQSRRWIKKDTYGGKLTENITSGICRDLLTFALDSLRQDGYHVVMHVHDEVVAEVPAGQAERSLAGLVETMCRKPAWAEGIPLKAAGFISEYYKKD